MTTNGQDGFSDRVAIVTGGAAGIGEGIVRALADLGAQVTIADKDRETADSHAADVHNTGEAEMERYDLHR